MKISRERGLASGSEVGQRVAQGANKRVRCRGLIRKEGREPVSIITILLIIILVLIALYLVRRVV
jgi:hypothetical protein